MEQGEAYNINNFPMHSFDVGPSFRKKNTLTSRIEEIKKSPALVGCSYQTILILIAIIVLLVSLNLINPGSL